MADSLSLAFLVLLESLSPEQRAAFLLHDVFGYGYGEVAEIVGKSEDNARQLAARARRHVDERRPRFEASRGARPAGAALLRRRAQDGDVDALERHARRGRGAARRRRRQGPALRPRAPRRPARGPRRWQRGRKHGARIPGSPSASSR
jgi:hypothetical protein